MTYQMNSTDSTNLLSGPVGREVAGFDLLYCPLIFTIRAVLNSNNDYHGAIMSNIAAVLRQEITRLARREARAITKSLSKASGQYRKDIAELKRQNAKARAEIIRLQRQASKGGAAPAAEAAVEKVRYSAVSVMAQRKRLGLSAADFGKLIGVTSRTIYQWEHGAARPRSSLLAAFVAVRGIGKTEANARLQELRVKVPKGRKKAK
jgi:DNA-binding transcriptional regulator YiaG